MTTIYELEKLATPEPLRLKELERLLSRRDELTQRIEDKIKDKIAAVCRKYNADFHCFSSTFYGLRGGSRDEIENASTKRVDALIGWFEEYVGHFDPQSICRKGYWR